MDQGAVQIVGLTDLRKALRDAADASPREITAQLKKGAVQVAALAQELAPKKTGALAASLKPFATQKSGGVKSNLVYSGVQEFKRSYPGTPPRFGFRAIDQLGPQLAQQAFDAIVEILQCHGWFA